MLRGLNLISILVCGFLSGCMAALPITVSSDRPTRDLSDKQRSTLDFDFNLNDPAERQKALAKINHEIMGQSIAETPPGSQVSVVVDFDHRYTGTLLKGETNSIELMNCIGKEAVSGPNGQLQCKTSHVPFQSFKTSSMTSFSVIAPPRPDFALPDINQDSRAVTVADIVYKDGRHQRWGQPPEMGNSDHATGSAVVE